LNRCEQVSAGLLATAADLGTDPAVLVVGGVLLALLGAGPAGHYASVDRSAENAEVRLGLPDEDATGGVAHVGAVQAEANAAELLLYVRLGEVGVGVARARRRAVDAVLDAADQQVAIERVGPWVCLEHVSNRHVLSFLFGRSGEILGLRLDHLRMDSGVFGARMQVELVNDGPVTIVLDVRGSDSDG
jgi:hypothetical protein